MKKLYGHLLCLNTEYILTVTFSGTAEMQKKVAQFFLAIFF